MSCRILDRRLLQLFGNFTIGILFRSKERGSGDGAICASVSEGGFLRGLVGFRRRAGVGRCESFGFELVDVGLSFGDVLMGGG